MEDTGWGWLPATAWAQENIPVWGGEAPGTDSSLPAPGEALSFLPEGSRAGLAPGRATEGLQTGLWVCASACN